MYVNFNIIVSKLLKETLMRLEKKATVVSTSVAALLVIIKMIVGVMSGSIAVLASAVDSLLDLTVSLFNYFALSTAEKNPDEQFHFGRSKIEPLAAVIEGTVISFSALFILYGALSKIVHPKAVEHVSASIGVMLFSIVITAFLVLFLISLSLKSISIVIFLYFFLCEGMGKAKENTLFPQFL